MWLTKQGLASHVLLSSLMNFNDPCESQPMYKEAVAPLTPHNFSYIFETFQQTTTHIATITVTSKIEFRTTVSNLTNSLTLNQLLCTLKFANLHSTQPYSRLNKSYKPKLSRNRITHF